MSDGTKSAEGRGLMTSVDCRCNSHEICNGLKRSHMPGSHVSTIPCCNGCGGCSLWG
jgi:hypothetical protein